MFHSVCETIAYLYLGCVIGAIVMFYITFKHRREFLHFFNSGKKSWDDSGWSLSRLDFQETSPNPSSS